MENSDQTKCSLELVQGCKRSTVLSACAPWSLFEISPNALSDLLFADASPATVPVATPGSGTGAGYNAKIFPLRLNKK